jgi:hypothetical protein
MTDYIESFRKWSELCLNFWEAFWNRHYETLDKSNFLKLN